MEVVTMDLEHVNVEALKAIESLYAESSSDSQSMKESAKNRKVSVFPKPSTIEVIQDKFKQKKHYSSHEIPTSRFEPISCVSDIKRVIQEWGDRYPVMLKSRREAYDGKGNYPIKDEDQIETAFSFFYKSFISKNPEFADQDHNTIENVLYLEEWIHFETEISVIGTIGSDGDISPFPVVDTFHSDSIVRVVTSPSRCHKSIQEEATKIAKKVIKSFNTDSTERGVFAVEMFVEMLKETSNSEDGQRPFRVLVNEVAPRPHNSGHLTIESCNTSQFSQHMKAICGFPIMPEVNQTTKSSVMFNIIGVEGEDVESQTGKIFSQLFNAPLSHLHFYHKYPFVAKRKLGHITYCSNELTVPELLKKVASENQDISADLFGIDPDHFIATYLKNGPKLSLKHLSSNSIPLVGIIMGSDSDLPAMKKAAEALTAFQIPFEISIVSAHRTPDRMFDYAKSAASRGIRVIIAGAGGAAHLPGMVASLTHLPVIGVPIKIEPLLGLDSLLSIVQMPQGIPVATVAINNSANAGILAARILASSPEMSQLAQHLKDYASNMSSAVMSRVERLEEKGWEHYTPPGTAK